MAAVRIQVNEDVKQSLQKLCDSVEDLNMKLQVFANNQEFLIDVVQGLRGDNQGKYQNLHFTSYDIEDSGLKSQFGTELKASKVNDSDGVGKIENKKDAYNMFDEMPKRNGFKQDDTVKTYYDAFHSFYGKMGFDECYVVSLFICGLQPEIKKAVSMFNPKTLYDAYCLANMQESTNNLMKGKTSSLLLPVFSLKDTNEVNNGSDDCVNFDKSGEVVNNDCLESLSPSKLGEESDKGNEIESNPTSLKDDIKDIIAASNDFKDESLNTLCINQCHLVYSECFASDNVNVKSFDGTIQMHAMNQNYDGSEGVAAVKKNVGILSNTLQFANESEAAMGNILNKSNLESLAVCMSDGVSNKENVVAKDDNSSKLKHPIYLITHVEFFLAREMGWIQIVKDRFKRKTMIHLWPKWKSKHACFNNIVVARDQHRDNQKSTDFGLWVTNISARKVFNIIVWVLSLEKDTSIRFSTYPLVTFEWFGNSEENSVATLFVVGNSACCFWP